MATEYANIMLMGLSKAGKSSFINYLVGKPVCRTGAGMPITQCFDEYTYQDVDGLPLRIYDSKGLEVKDYQAIRADIIHFLKEHCESDNIKDWMHAIFYCININSARLQPAEVELLRQLRSEIAQNIHFIITHCRQDEKGQLAYNQMVELIHAELGNEGLQIFPVNSVEVSTRGGTYELFGRQAVLDKIFELLWSDISRKLAHDFSHELFQGEQAILRDLENTAKQFLKNINSIGFITAAVRDEIDAYFDALSTPFDNLDQKWDKLFDDLTQKYRARILPLVDFCTDCGHSFGQDIYFYDAGDFLEVDVDNVDLDSVIDNSKLGQLSEQIDAAKSTWAQMRAVCNAIHFLLTFKQRCKELVDAILDEIKAAFPERQKIEDTVYDLLTKDFHYK